MTRGTNTCTLYIISSFRCSLRSLKLGIPKEPCRLLYPTFHHFASVTFWHCHTCIPLHFWRMFASKRRSYIDIQLHHDMWSQFLNFCVFVVTLYTCMYLLTLRSTDHNGQSFCSIYSFGLCVLVRYRRHAYHNSSRVVHVHVYSTTTMNMTFLD